MRPYTLLPLVTAAALTLTPVEAHAESNPNGSITASSDRAQRGDAFPVTIGCTSPTATGYQFFYNDFTTPARTVTDPVEVGKPFSGLATTFTIPADASLRGAAVLHLYCLDASGVRLTDVSVFVTAEPPPARPITVTAPAELHPGTFDVSVAGCDGEPASTPVQLVVLLVPVGDTVAAVSTTLGALAAGPAGTRVFTGVSYLRGDTAVDYDIAPTPFPVKDGGDLQIRVSCSAGDHVTDSGETEAVYRTAALVTAPPITTPAPAPAAAVSAAPAAAQAAPVLPFTGTPVGGLLALGSGLVVLGAGLVRAGRRRAAPTAA